MTGHLIAFEGLDQSGKQTQAEQLRDYLSARGRDCRLLSFPDYETTVGREISQALHGERDYTPDVMQLLYVTNRYEKRPQIQSWIDDGTIVLCDRYLASSVAYGEAQGLDPEWLTHIQRYLPVPSLTILLDIAPGDGGPAESRRPRSLRARSRAAVARAKELRAAGTRRRLAAPRRRAIQG